MWAEATWCQWLPRHEIIQLVEFALAMVENGAIAWAKVRGPAAAFVATALRLGWVVHDALHLTTDRGVAIDLQRDSPAFVTAEVRKAVWRWRWRRAKPSTRASQWEMEDSAR